MDPVEASALATAVRLGKVDDAARVACQVFDGTGGECAAFLAKVSQKVQDLFDGAPALAPAEPTAASAPAVELSGAANSPRKLSQITSTEMEALHEALHAVFDEYAEGDPPPSINVAQLQKLVEDKGLADAHLSPTDVDLIFTSTKLGKKTELNFERFQEAFRKIAMKKKSTYQNCVLEMMGGDDAAGTGGGGAGGGVGGSAHPPAAVGPAAGGLSPHSGANPMQGGGAGEDADGPALTPEEQQAKAAHEGKKDKMLKRQVRP
jgi:hypothetical protein